MPAITIKDVKMSNKYIIKYIFILWSGTLILGCDKKEEIYMDYDEVKLYSNHQLNLKKNGGFFISNEQDTIFLYFKEEKVRSSNLESINFLPTDSVITRLSKITLDDLLLKEEKDFPNLFIVKRDSKEELIIIEVGQTFPISRDNFEIN